MARVIIPTCTLDVSTAGRPDQTATISPEDFPRLRKLRWHVDSHGYAAHSAGSGPTRKKLFMHRLIVAAPCDTPVDHRNGTPLDNRRENLRLATDASNRQNRRSNGKRELKGVFKNTKGATWMASIRKDGKTTYLGCFSDPNAAARAYDRKALELFGEFAQLNFPRWRRVAVDLRHPRYWLGWYAEARQRIATTC